MTWDSTWEKVFKEKEWGKYPAESVIRFVARNFYSVPKRSEIKILDAGCGAGANLWFMAREGFKVYGVDGSKTAIERANNRLKKELGDQFEKLVGGGVFVGDMQQLPFENDFFDAVIDARAISCNDYESSKKIYRELARVCKSKGKLYTTMYASGTWGLNESGISTEGFLASTGFHRLTKYEEIEDLITDWNILTIDKFMQTLDGIKNDHWIKEWIITASKK